MLYRLLRAVMRLAVSVVIGEKLDVRGAEHIPHGGSLLVVGNHVATIDPPLLGAVIERTDLHFMAKSEHFRHTSTRWIFHGYHAFPVIRGTADRQALRHALTLLHQGHAVVVYPEGSRSWDGRLRRPHAGAGFLARHAGAQVLPVAMWGTERVLTKQRWWPRRAPIHVRFGEPFTIPETTEQGRRIDSQHAADLMMAHVAALLPRRYRGVFDGSVDLEAVPPPAA